MIQGNSSKKKKHSSSDSLKIKQEKRTKLENPRSRERELGYARIINQQYGNLIYDRSACWTRNVCKLFLKTFFEDSSFSSGGRVFQNFGPWCAMVNFLKLVLENLDL